MRLAIGVLLALLVNFGLFVLMQHMISNKEVDKRVTEDIRLLDFVRIKQEETQPETKTRQLPRKPPPPELPPPLPQTLTARADKPEPPKPQFDTPKIDIPMNIGGGPYLGDFARAVDDTVASGSIQGLIVDNDVVPLVRIPPKYPRIAARRGIQGVVTVQFIITKDGTVRDAKVINADPANVFNDEAMKAVLKWKFKPKLVEGQPVERQATQEIEFKLSQ